MKAVFACILFLLSEAVALPLGRGASTRPADLAQPATALVSTNRSAASLSTDGQSLLEDTTALGKGPALEGEPDGLFSTYGKGILIGLSVGCLLFAPFCCWKLCKKRIARQRMKNFQSRKRRKRTSAVRDDKIELCVTDCDDITKDDADVRLDARPAHPLAEAQKRGVCDPERDPKAESKQRSRSTNVRSSPPKSGSSLKSCATVLENLAYDDLITSLKVDTSGRSRPAAAADDTRSKRALKRPPEAVYNTGDASQYVNVDNHLARNKRREHAYETIGYQESDGKTLQRLNPPPSPIQIKRQSKSEDVTIFPFNPDQPNYEDIDVHRVPENDRPIPKLPEPPPSKNPEVKREPKAPSKPNKSTLSSRASMCVNPSLEIEPSPYLQRTWSAPNAATMERQPRESPPAEPTQPKPARTKARSPKLRLSKSKIKARIAEAIERKEDLIGELTRKIDDKSQRQHAGLRPMDNRFTYCDKPRMRRRVKRKVRKKRRVLDERRRTGIQRMRSRDDAAARGRQNEDGDVTSQEGRNRWPLPGVCFESSSGSGSDVWRFRSPLVRSEAYRDAAKREASLLEDIWCHLDEIAQRAGRMKESYSSRRASDSLSSLSDDVIIRHGAEAPGRQLALAPSDTRFATRDSVSSDRGYYTYKCFASSGAMRRVLERQRRRNGPLTRPRPHSCIVMTSSGMSTLTDTGTGAWMSSTATRCSSFSSSRNNSLFDASALARRDKFDFNRFVIPKITLTAPNDTAGTSDAVAAMNKGEESYLSLLDLYLGRVGEPIYEQLSNCVTQLAGARELSDASNRERPPADGESQSDKVRVKGDKAGYAVIVKRPCVQEVTYVNVHVEKRENSEPKDSNDKADENVSDSERTSDTIRNGSVGSIDDVIVTPSCDVTRPKRQFVVERSGKNYVVVAPALPRMRLTSSDDSVVDVKTRTGDVNDCVKTRREDETTQAADDSGFCVFMEMSV